jgi:hypothetical protein
MKERTPMSQTKKRPMSIRPGIFLIISLIASVITPGLSKNSFAFEDRIELQLRQGATAIQMMTGCFLVDYNFVETESLKEGYTRNSRWYDVNKEFTTKEWIYSEVLSPQRIRLQHILFQTNS